LKKKWAGIGAVSQTGHSKKTLGEGKETARGVKKKKAEGLRGKLKNGISLRKWALKGGGGGRSGPGRGGGLNGGGRDSPSKVLSTRNVPLQGEATKKSL